MTDGYAVAFPTSETTLGHVMATPESSVYCIACGAKRTTGADHCASVPCNVREFAGQRFDVWRCGGCGSIHSDGDIDYDAYYRNYPLQRQKLDFFTRRLMGSRLAQLVAGGLRMHHTVLDYGCGSGAFVEHLKAHGFSSVQGFDPYSSRYGDRRTLDTQYDFVTSQDVVEHTPDPLGFISELAALVRPEGGIAAIGSPNARYVDIHGRLDAVGELHQPYHRHILTNDAIRLLLEDRGLEVTRVMEWSYVETRFPYLNSRFLNSYLIHTGGYIDAWFDPIRFDVVLRHPKLILLGLFGGWARSKKNMLVFATRHS